MHYRHISIIGAKLKKMLPEGTVDKIEDLEDHYERALQMRVCVFPVKNMCQVLIVMV